MTDERRRFSRIDFDARVEIAQSSKTWQAQLLDISLKGVLLAKMGSYQLQAKIPVLVKIILSDLTTIAMTTRVIQDSPEQMRLACDSIDIDSISHLRRLIELNLGFDKAIERELSELMSGIED